MKKSNFFTSAFIKAISQFCSIIGAVMLTFFIFYHYGIKSWYSLVISVVVSAILANITIGGIKRYLLRRRKILKIFYTIPLAGIVLLFLIVLEPSMPYRWIGFMIFILMVGIPADMIINCEPNKGLFGALTSLNSWDIITDIAISMIAGYIVASYWSNAIIIVITLIIAYAIILLWNFSVNSKGPKHSNNNNAE